MYRFYKTFFRAMAMPEARAPISAAFALIATGTVFYMLIEDWTFVDSLYFSVTTLTTVGFGNPAPSTDLGKIFTVFFVIGGVGIFLGVLNAIGLEAAKEPAKKIPRLRRSPGQQELSDRFAEHPDESAGNEDDQPPAGSGGASGGG